MPQQLTVEFAITGLPDTSGLRIKTLSPTGVYISSKDADAAKWHFEFTTIELILKRKLLQLDLGQALAFLHSIDWDDALTNGYGEVVVRVMTVEEVLTLKQSGHPVIIPPVQKLQIEWWTDPDEQPFCIGRDDTEMIDSWLIEMVKKDFEEKSKARS